MQYVIRKNDDGTWVVCSVDGDTLVVLSATPHTEYDAAVRELGDVLTAQYRELAAADMATGDVDNGLLPDGWTSEQGIAFSRELAGGRDFSEVEWSWRDPTTSLLPLMYQHDTAWGHDGAELAGFIEELSESGGTVSASGRFYDSEVGIAARDLLLDGRRFGVSVDPSEAVDAEFRCTEVDEDGWCVAGITAFLAYEIAGLTMTPFPAFEEANIVLDTGSSVDDEPAPADTTAAVSVQASARTALVAPPAEWFDLAEPRLGEPFLGTLGDEFLVDQGDGSVACPLTITDDGQVFGHVARWGECHVGYPGMCITPPDSAAMYAHFNVGEARCAEGERRAVGALTIGCEHAPDDMLAWQARDHYANAGSGWANVHASSGEYGPWVAGALRPNVTDDQLAVLRALALSGDWRRIGGHLELIGALSVNVPGFPIAREAVTASGLALVASAAMPSGRMEHGEQMSLVAAGMVARCTDCQRRRAAGLSNNNVRDDGETVRLLRTLERRTRHLIPDAARAARERMR